MKQKFVMKNPKKKLDKKSLNLIKKVIKENY